MVMLLLSGESTSDHSGSHGAPQGLSDSGGNGDFSQASSLWF